jgi:site-specific DNA-adenine methylase
MNYGIPYKGSKNKIAESILAQLPPAKHFYDLFGGGGAMTHCALLSGKYKYVHYNEFNPLAFKAFKMAVNGEFEGETRWISREDFEKLKDTDPYVAICFSFGNNLKNYAYNKECEKFKKAVHYSIFFNDNSLLKEYIDLSNFNYSSENLKERRLELQRYLTVLLRENKLERKVYTNFNSVGNARNVIKNLERLERLESLERFMSFNPSGNVQNLLQNMNRLEHIPQISNKVILTNLSYEEVPIESDSVIYCDPPYKETGTYLNDFDHEKFYSWLRSLKQQVFISEYQMPNDFYEVFSIKKRVSFSQKQNTCKLEKLFSTLKT